MSDPLTELESLLDELPAAVDRRRFGDTLANSLTTLSDADRVAERIRALLSLVHELGFGNDKAQAETIEEAREAVVDAGRALETAETPAELKSAVQIYKDSLPAVSNLDKNVRQHWRTVTQRQFQPLIAVGELLSQIDAGSDLGKQLAACGKEALAVPEALAVKVLLERVCDLLRKRDALQSRRRQEQGEGDIAAFVNALAENRASLDMVTDEVRAWLAMNHSLDKLKVRAA